MNESDETSKIFLYNTLLVYIRLYREIAITIASFEIATLLINNGRITHS